MSEGTIKVTHTAVFSAANYPGQDLEFAVEDAMGEQDTGEYIIEDAMLAKMGLYDLQEAFSVIMSEARTRGLLIQIEHRLPQGVYVVRWKPE